MAELKNNSKVVDNEETEEELTLKSSFHEKKLDAEDLAPDGGWGWAVAAGMTVANVIVMAPATTFGLIYSEFLDATGNGGSALTALNLMVLISVSASGLVCNELLKKFDIKSVGIIGALIYATCNTLTCLAPDVPTMALLFFLQGIGMGMAVTVCNISFNAYFVKLRTKVMAASQVVIGLGTITFPIISENLLRNYGFRGCVALLGAMSFNMVISMFVMDPVHKHYKKPKPKVILSKNNIDKSQEMNSKNLHQNLIIINRSDDIIRRHSLDGIKENEKNGSVRSLAIKENSEHEIPLLIKSSKNLHKSQERCTSGIDIETGFRLRPGKGLSLEILANRLSMTGATSITSINGIPGFTKFPENEPSDEMNEKKKSIRSTLAEFFEISLLRDGTFVNICIGNSLHFTTDILFVGFIPMIMTSKGYTQSDITAIVTIDAISQLVGKILFIIFAMFFKIKSRYVYLGAVYCVVCSRTAFLFCTNLKQIMIVIGFIGIARSWYAVNQTLVLAEHFKIEKFAAAWGVFSVIIGLGAIIVCPSIGILKDITNSYDITQYALLSCSIIFCVIPWTTEILIYDVFGRKKNTDTIP